MKELIERIEGAEGPSRELDCAIVIAADRRPEWLANQRGEMWLDTSQRFPVIRWRSENMERSTGNPPVDEVPSFTASLDAAMTLVPEGEGRWPQLYYTGPNPNNSRQGHRWQIWIKGRGSPHFGHSQYSSALALVAAALRTRTALTAKDER